jgi:membrane protein
MPENGAAEPAASSPAEVSPAGWVDVLKRTWREAGEDNLSLVASGIAFNAFLAFVPLLTAVVLSYGLIAAPEQVARHMTALTQMMPREAASLIGGQLKTIVESAGSAAGFGLLLSLAIALYGAMRGASGVITGLNIAFNVRETRGFVRLTLTALAITLGLVVVFVVASLAISVLGFVEHLLPALGGAMHAMLQLGFWLVAAVAVSLVVAAIYRYAPNRPDTPWRWVTPGSALATLVWIAATFAFSFYVSNFGSYNATYGALGAVIVFLTWLYLSAYIVLLGAELNQVLERKAGGPEAYRPAEPLPRTGFSGT